MLIVNQVIKADLPCLIAIDPYVPFSFKTYTRALSGVRYFRIGNFSTSLLETGIDPSSLAIRKVCLVSFSRVLTRDQLQVVQSGQEAIGLPIVCPDSLSGDRTDELCEFDVCVHENSLSIDWSHGKQLSSVVRFQRVCFYLAENELRRVTLEDLNTSEIDVLAWHMSSRQG